MPMSEVNFGAARPIDGYGPGFFRIGGRVHEGAVLVTATGTGPWGGFDDAAPLLALATRVDVLLIGTGAEMAALPLTLTRALDAAGIGAEPMATPTAARSYNLLLAEGRRVAAALLPVP